MKKIILFILTVFVICCVNNTISAQSISYVKERNGYFCLYGINGQIYNYISNDKMTLIGYSSQLAVFKRGTFYHVYSSTAKRLTVVDADLIGRIIKVTDDGCISQRRNTTYMWDEYGKTYKIIDR